MMNSVPEVRVRTIGHQQVLPEREFVLYWMIAFRRGHHNFSLERAVEWAKRLNKPLVILEALRCDYRWVSDRLHRFVLQGMADNAEHFGNRPVLYYPYVESKPGEGRGLLRELTSRACVTVTDDYPCFFIPRMLAAVSRRIPCRFELVDSNGLLPMRTADRVFARAFDFRRFLQKNLLPHLAETPRFDPLSRAGLPRLASLPASVTNRWPMADPAKWLSRTDALDRLPIDHSVAPVETVGGTRAANRLLQSFLKSRLPIYASDRNQPDRDATSGLSPYLHFGQISAHQVFEELARTEEWTPNKVSSKVTGSSGDWWGLSEDAESFLDELITWRELGYNMCWQRDDYAEYDSLPNWAQQTLAEHAVDHRPHVYTRDAFETAQTHDALWNAAQRQLVREGRIHNYLRMLWGKKILEWSATPKAALDVMIELNNKYALDGRDPNSYSGIFWVLGRYDRAWGPERPIYGKIRYMSSDNTARKVNVKNYIRQYAAE